MAQLAVATVAAFVLLIIQTYYADIFDGHFAGEFVKASLGYLAVVVVSGVALVHLWTPHPVRSVQSVKFICWIVILLLAGGFAAPLAIGRIHYRDLTIEFGTVTFAVVIAIGICLWFLRWAEIEYGIRYRHYFG